MSSGGWSGEPIGCEYVDCGEVAGLLQGAVHYTDGRNNFGARDPIYTAYSIQCEAIRSEQFENGHIL